MDAVSGKLVNENKTEEKVAQKNGSEEIGGKRQWELMNVYTLVSPCSQSHWPCELPRRLGLVAT